MNMKKQPLVTISRALAGPLQAISSPQKIAILLAIGEGEACVCHLEAALGWRQAYISQHLMALRKAGVLTDRREGRYVFYRLKDWAYLDLIRASAALCDSLGPDAELPVNVQSYPACECPHCAPAVIPLKELKA
jgi:ArsR family transcriptional regulator